MVDNNVVSTRNLIDTGLGPLRKFTGILDSMPTEKRVYGEGESARSAIRVSLNFKDIEVLQAVEPYHFPIYTVECSLSNRKMSRWGVLSAAFNLIADQQYSKEQLDPTNAAYIKPADRMDLKDAIGKRVGMVMADGEEDRPKPPNLYDVRSGAERPTPSWVVHSIEGLESGGVAGKTPMDLAMELLNGKTLPEFNKEAMANSAIRGDIALLQAISKPVSAADSFANTMIVAGKFTRDEQEVYHKVE